MSWRALWFILLLPPYAAPAEDVSLEIQRALRSLQAGNSADEWNVRVEVQMAAVPMAEALKLLPQFKRAAEFPAAYDRLQTMLADGRADLLGWPIVRSTSGGRAISESVEEVRYATEFNPPQLPQSIGLWEPPPHDMSSIFASKHLPPTAFDTRNCLGTLEVDSTVNAKGAIELAISPSWVNLEAMEPGIGATRQEPRSIAKWQPRVSNLRVHSFFTIANGGRALIGVFVQQAPKPRVVLFLLHAVATRPSPLSP